MAVNNWRNLSGYTADSVANYNDAYQHQRKLWYSDADAHSTASGLLQPAPVVTPSAPATTPAFSNQEVYNIQSQGYRNAGNNSLADAYGNIANNLWAYSTFANNTLQGYDSLLNYVRNNENWLQALARGYYNNLMQDLESSRNYANQMFGPNGELTKEVNQYYDDLGNYLSTDAGRQAAAIAAQWVHSGASLGAIRAQQNAAYNESFGRYVQAKEQQINAKQQLAANLLNYMSALRQEYWDTTNQYVIDLYKRANDMYNSIAQSAAADLNQYNTLMASRVGSWWGWNPTTDTPSIEDIKLNVNNWQWKIGMEVGSDWYTYTVYTDASWNKSVIWTPQVAKTKDAATKLLTQQWLLNDNTAKQLWRARTIGEIENIYENAISNPAWTWYVVA